MPQPAIFVTYLPERALESRRLSAARDRREPLLALLAGVFAMGGAIAVATPSIGHAAMTAGPIARVKLSETQRGSAGGIPVPATVVAMKHADVPGTVPAPVAPPAKVARVAEPAHGPSGGRGPGTLLPKVRAPVALRMPVAPTPEPAAAAVAAAVGIVPPVAELLQPASQDAASYPTVMVGDRSIGAVTVIGGRIHLASLLGLLKLKMPAADYARLHGSRAADVFVTAQQLRDAGIDASFDPDRDRILLATPDVRTVK